MNLTPELSISISDDNGLIGYLVIDSTINGRCSGGVRIIPKLCKKDMKSIAHTMTLKFGFLGFTTGGAKACVIMPADTAKKQREEILYSFGEKIGPLIRKGIYIPATDMNCSIDDIKMMYRGAKMKARFKAFNDISYLYTAWTVVESALVAAQGIGLSAAIDGAGKVGMECAKLLHEKGVKVCAVSTLKGAIYNKDGLDVEFLVELKKRYGDYCIKYAKERKIPISKVSSLDVDMLIPAAQANSINTGNRRKIKAKVISCAANSPMDNETYQFMHEKGVIVIPDHIANCGGVLGSFLERSTKKEVIKSIVGTEFSEVIGKLIDKSKKEGRSVRDISGDMIMARFRQTKEREEKRMKGRIIDFTQMQATRLGHKLLQEKYRKNIFADLM